MLISERVNPLPTHAVTTICVKYFATVGLLLAESGQLNTGYGMSRTETETTIDTMIQYNFFSYLYELSRIASIIEHHKVYLKLSKYFFILLDSQKMCAKICSLKKGNSSCPVRDKSYIP